jgi:hypothetical protein
MAWKLMKVGSATNAPSNYYVVDTTNDIKLLDPVFGDRAFVIGANGDVLKTYICNSQGTWYCIEDSSKSPVTP